MQYIMIIGLSGALSIFLSGIIVIIYNLFIGFPRGIIITKQKKYKTVKATRIVSINEIRDENRDDEWKKGKHWFRFEWEINGKKYKRLIHTTAWVPGPYETFYYLNPKYAMPIPRELAYYRYEIQTLLVNWVICFLFFMKYYNLI